VQKSTPRTFFFSFLPFRQQAQQPQVLPAVSYGACKKMACQLFRELLDWLRSDVPNEIQNTPNNFGYWFIWSVHSSPRIWHADIFSQTHGKLT
jgi:hypothetical protein